MTQHRRALYEVSTSFLGAMILCHDRDIARGFDPVISTNSRVSKIPVLSKWFITAMSIATLAGESIPNTI